MDFDVIIVGGSYAGLSAALALGRARKRALVIDAGSPRNRFAQAAHNLLGQDGRSPSSILQAARAELAGYPSIRSLHGNALSADSTPNGFTIELADGTTQTAARLILATGVVDDLPPLPGLRERWGKDVLHCPYCHGFEFAGQRLGVLALGAPALHQARMIPDWGPTTLLTNNSLDLTTADRSALVARGLQIEDGQVAEIISRDDRLIGARLASGRVVALDAIFVAAPWRFPNPLAEHLGCAIDDTQLGPMLRLDATRQTTVRGVYAAGDASEMMKSLPAALYSGAIAGAMVHQSLLG